MDIPSLITNHISTANDTAAAILAPRAVSLQAEKPTAARPTCVRVNRHIQRKGEVRGHQSNTDVEVLRAGRRAGGCRWFDKKER